LLLEKRASRAEFVEVQLALFRIDEETCNQCGLCVEICTGNFVVMEEDDYPTESEDAEEICIRCGHCVTICPSESFALRGMPPEKCPPVQKDLLLTPEHCEHFLRYRRSIRDFKKKPVSKDTLTRLIEIARYAPSGFNSQCAEWIVLGDRDELNRLAGIVADWMRWMIAKLPDVSKAIHLDKDLQLWDDGRDVIFQDAPVVIVTHAEKANYTAPETCTIALTYLELAATSLGLGCCWAGYLEKAATFFPPMQEALALPEGHKCFGAMMIGYPKYKHLRLAARNEPKITWHM
jgi:nitroreductase/NAD-dependent dihydropyrimidine dehydrogenase PreA subunit